MVVRLAWTQTNGVWVPCALPGCRCSFHWERR